MSKPWINLLVSIGVIGSMTLAANISSAEDRAKTDFINNCASCHGEDGTGNGPMSVELKVKTPDLTTLTKGNGSEFPYLKIRKIIDGSYATGTLRSHGSKDMPVWGDVFRRNTSDYSSYADAQARIMNIVDYLARIQK